MQSLNSFTRKYAIMEELDSGFSSGSTPEAFVRLDSWEGRIQASVHVKGLKQGPFQYMLYLIFDKEGSLIPLLAGTMNVSYSGMQSGLEIEASVLKENGVKPDLVRYAAITAEDNNRKWIPLFSSFDKSFKWDESIRQVLLKKTYNPIVENKVVEIQTRTDQIIEKNVHDEDIQEHGEDIQEKNIAVQLEPKSENAIKQVEENIQAPVTEVLLDDTMKQNIETAEPVENKVISASTVKDRNYEKPKAFPVENTFFKCDVNRLEGLLQNSFERYVPFKRSHRGYSWYRVSDLSKLSNIMYLTGVNVPVFANPKILVGLFKYKHVLAGLYRGDDLGNYYVIGVPAKNERDNRPFEKACRWVPLKDSDVRDMGGYWLVYVSLKTGEIVV
mgnify:CR=1 FL=1